MNAAPTIGVLPVDKPPGPTSHDLVNAARRALGERRVGHTGTLDPFASGLLLLCVGQATRLAEYLTGLDKGYEATARLGVTTDSGDRDGATISVSDGWAGVTPEAVEAALDPLRGSILQTPPALSAKKVGGVPAHRRVRKGEDVALEPHAVTVHELEVVDVVLPDVRLRVRCSSGTYVRALARDMGEALGVGAHLTALRRTSVGPFRVEAAVAPDAMGDADAVTRAMIPPLAAMGHLPLVEVDDEGAARLVQGRRVAAPGMAGAAVAVAALGPTLVAVGEVRDGLFLPRKVLAHD
jgi:tRNA pseudouridine55 synthase